MFNKKNKKTNIYLLLKKTKKISTLNNYTKVTMLHFNKNFKCYTGLNSFLLKKNNFFKLNKTTFHFIITKQPKPYPFKMIKNKL